MALMTDLWRECSRPISDLRVSSTVSMTKRFRSMTLSARAEASPKLCQCQLAVTIRCNRFAAFAEFRVAAAIAHDTPHLLAFDIAVDAGHPRVDLGEQQAFAGLEYMVGPGNRAL